MKVDPRHLIVLQALLKGNGIGNVTEFLQLTAAQFQTAFEIANDMQNLDYVKLLYSNFNKNQVIVEITLWGEACGKA